MKEGQQRGATDWWSPVSRQKRGVMSWGRERQMLKELFVCTDWKDCGAENIVHMVCMLQLVSCFNVSFLCVLIQIMCKHKNMQACWRTHRRTHTSLHTHTQKHVFLTLTCVFIKESSCSIVLRSNGDWLWHNYANPCMNLVLMEAEHLTQTKCRRADQCRWAFFFRFTWAATSSLQNRTFTYAMYLL